MLLLFAVREPAHVESEGVSVAVAVTAGAGVAAGACMDKN